MKCLLALTLLLLPLSSCAAPDTPATCTPYILPGDAPASAIHLLDLAGESAVFGDYPGIRRSDSLPEVMPDALSRKLLAELQDKANRYEPTNALQNPLFHARAGELDLVWYLTHVRCTNRRTGEQWNARSLWFAAMLQQHDVKGRVTRYALAAQPDRKTRLAAGDILRDALHIMAASLPPSPASPTEEEAKEIYWQKLPHAKGKYSLHVRYSTNYYHEPRKDAQGRLRYVRTERLVGEAWVRRIPGPSHGGSLVITFDLETGEVLSTHFTK